MASGGGRSALSCWRASGLSAVFLSAVVLPAVIQAHPCPGDCDANGRVTATEISLVVEAVFVISTVDCPFADANLDARVSAADVVAAAAALIDAPPECQLATPEPTTTTSQVATVTATRTPAPVATGDSSATSAPTATPSPVSTPASTWIRLAPLAEGPRQEVGVAALGGTIYVIGGFDGEGRVEAYDVSTDRWSTLAPLPAARNHVGAAAAGGRIYTVGGFAGLGFSPVATVYRYDPVTDEWTTVTPLPTARGALAVAELDGKLYAVGGSGPAGSVARHDVYDPATNTWTNLAALPSARNHLAAAAIDGFVYVIGGRGGPNTAELDRYDPVTDRWEVLAPMPTARSGLAAAAFAGRLVVMGGEVNPAHTQGVFPQVEVYDPSTGEWTSLSPMAVPRHGIGAVTVGALIYVPGGATAAGFDATDRNDALGIKW